MATKLADKLVKALPAPEAKPGATTNAKITYDSEVSGLGCRVTTAGARSFVLNYRTRSGRERRFTIGPVGEWTVAAARAEAKELKKQIGRGEDPLALLRADREAPTVADLCERFKEEHLPKKRPKTQQGYGDIIDKHVLPKLQHMKVSEITFADVDDLHRKLSKAGAPYQANRMVAVLSKMFSLAIRWGWRTDNPAKGIERNPENKRDRYLSADELARLSEAMVGDRDQQGVNISRLLLLTGARSQEVCRVTWDQLDLKEGVWTKPGHTTKQATVHRVPLSGPARLLLSDLHAEAVRAAARRGASAEDVTFVFPGRFPTEPRKEFRRTWYRVCKAAKIKGVRPHDIRHSYGAVLASSNYSELIIGRLLGHTQASTTRRYAHLADDPLRFATERAGAIIGGNKGGNAEIIKLGGKP